MPKPKQAKLYAPESPARPSSPFNETDCDNFVSDPLSLDLQRRLADIKKPYPVLRVSKDICITQPDIQLVFIGDCVAITYIGGIGKLTGVYYGVRHLRTGVKFEIEWGPFQRLGLGRSAGVRGRNVVVFMRTLRKVWSLRVFDLGNAEGGWGWNQGLWL